ncbi:sporulation integral membrane protein YtvI [Virgibacillus ainsalahensis]
MYKPVLLQIFRAIIVIALLLITYFTIKHVIMPLYPILLAIILAYMINPLVTFLEHRMKFPRSFATVTILFTVFVLVIGAFIFIITELIQGTIYLAEKVPTAYQVFFTNMEELIEREILPIYHKLISFFHTLDASYQISIKEKLQEITNYIALTGASLVEEFFLFIQSVLTALPNSATAFVFIVLATFFITNDWHQIKQSAMKVLPSSIFPLVSDIVSHLKQAIVGFTKAQIILISITAGIIFTGLTILQIEHALTIAFISAGLDLLPYIGTGVIFIPWIIYLFIAADYSLTISLCILYILIIIIRQIMEPKILSNSIGLNPLAALTALFVGIQLWGFLGMIIAPILLVLLNAFHQAGFFLKIWKFVKG